MGRGTLGAAASPHRGLAAAQKETLYQEMVLGSALGDSRWVSFFPLLLYGP